MSDIEEIKNHYEILIGRMEQEKDNLVNEINSLNRKIHRYEILYNEYKTCLCVCVTIGIIVCTLIITCGSVLYNEDITKKDLVLKGNNVLTVKYLYDEVDQVKLEKFLKVDAIKYGADAKEVRRLFNNNVSEDDKNEE